MIYKIIGKFDSVSFEKLLDKLSKQFSCIYISDTLYAGVKDYKYLDGSEEYLKKVLKPSKYFFVENIDDKNISKQTEIVQQWGSGILQTLYQQKIEKEQQDRLQQMMIIIDDFEAALQKKQQERRGNSGDK